MEVKTESGTPFNAAGSGTKGIAIAGLAAGATALVGGGLLNGLNWFGRGSGNCGVSQREMDYAQTVDALESALQREKSERYTDQAVINQAGKELNANKELYQHLIDIGVGVTRIDEQIKADRDKTSLREQILELKIANVEEKIKNSDDKFAGALALESERRINGDQNLYNYVNGTFVPGKLIMPASSICPECMPRYNSFVAPTSSNSGGTTA